MVNNEDKTLKYVGFVLSAVLCLFNLYDFVKDNSGPFEDMIEFVEGIVESIVGPIYDKFQDVLIVVLKFVDLKIDEYAIKLQAQLPPAASQALSAAQTVVSDVKRVGTMAAASGIVNSISDKYEAKVEQLAVKTLAELNQLPLVSQVAELLLPTVGYCLEKYNDAVTSAAEKGYAISCYLPLIPTEKIAKVVGADGAVRVWRSFFRSPGIRFSVFMI